MAHRTGSHPRGGCLQRVSPSFLWLAAILSVLAASLVAPEFKLVDLRWPLVFAGLIAAAAMLIRRARPRRRRSARRRAGPTARVATRQQVLVSMPTVTVEGTAESTIGDLLSGLRRALLSMTSSVSRPGPVLQLPTGGRVGADPSARWAHVLPPGPVSSLALAPRLLGGADAGGPSPSASPAKKKTRYGELSSGLLFSSAT